MIYIVDIDETICITPGDAHKARDYTEAKPLLKNIEKINKLYENDNKIIYWTARGTVTGIDWTEVTKNQLDSWGAKYHEINLGKPNYDVCICDKAINSRVFFQDYDV